MYTPAIVTICYNRPDSLKRLLSSIERADYPEGVSVPLVISIDKSDTDAVVKVAKEFQWKHGEKVVLERNPRMGLKAHVLACGDLTKDYGSIIVLEDDLYVSPSFYEYTVKALDFTNGDERIGGISLYNHLFNVHVRKSFCAIDDGYDNWYFQLASSWGQAYSKDQWDGFKAWLEIHKDDNLAKTFVPANVSSWSEKSWLKFYIAYLIDTDKYFLYPRISLTTNFGDVGSHAVKADADLQVPLMGRTKSLYCSFSKLEHSESVYDAFFENTRMRSDAFSSAEDNNDNKHSTDDSIDSNKDKKCLMDLYGYKPVEAMLKEDKSYDYVLSSKILPFKILKSYGRQMRPIEANIVYEVAGNDFYLYDVKIPVEITENIKATASTDSKHKEAVQYLYEYRGISASQMISMIKYRIAEKWNK